MSGGPNSTDSDSTSERRYFRIGTPGAVSSLHYDEYHNSFVQLAGTKRWWLMPPSSWHVAMGFPRGHDRARQSPRAPIFEWSESERRSAGARELLTSPGDVLYLPPYWLHQVRSL